MAETRLELGFDVSEVVANLRRVSDLVEGLAQDQDGAQKQIDASLKKQATAYEKEVSLLKKRFRELQKSGKVTKEAADAVEQYAKNVKKVDDKPVKSLNKSLDESKKNAKDAKDEIKGFDKLGPIFKKIGGFVVAAFAVDKIKDFVGALFNATKEIERTQSVAANLFGGGANTTEIASDARKLANVYSQEVNEVLKSAKILTDEFGISSEKAFSLIEQGIEKGADLNGDFLDQLTEYSTQFKAAGLEADEAIAIITQSVNKGVFSDKGADSIKEATIRLREMTPATKEAINSIGLSAEQIQKDLERGTKTYFEVVQEIVGKTKEVGINGAQAGQVLADVFGGAGEDAGSFIFQLDEVSTSLASIQENTGGVESAQRDLKSTWSDFIDLVFDGESIISKTFSAITRGASLALRDLTDFFSSADRAANNEFDNYFGDFSENAERSSDQLKDLSKRGIDELRKLAVEAQNQINSIEGGGGASTDEEQFKLELLRQQVAQANDLANIKKLSISDDEKNLAIAQRSLELSRQNQNFALEFESKQAVAISQNDKKNAKFYAQQRARAQANAEEQLADFKSRTAKLSDDIINNAEKIQTYVNTQDGLGFRRALQEEIGFVKERRAIADKARLDEANARKAEEDKRVRERAQAEAKRTAERRRAEQKRNKERFNQSLDRLESDSTKAEISGLTGEDKINAEFKQREAAIKTLNDKLLEEGRKAFGKEFELDQVQQDQLTILTIQAENDRTEKIEKIKAERNKKELQERMRLEDSLANIEVDSIGVEVDRVDNTEDLQLANLEARKEDFNSEAEFEAAKLEIQRNALEQRLALIQQEFDAKKTLSELEIARLEATGNVEDALKAENLRSSLENAEIANQANIQSVQNNLGKLTNEIENVLEGSGFSLAKLIGANDEDVEKVNAAFNSIFSDLSSAYSDNIQAQLDENQKLIDSIDEQISEQEEKVDREKDLAEQGKANNLSVEQEKIDELQAQKEEAIVEQEAIQEKQNRLQKAQQVVSLISAAASTFASLSAIPIVGPALAIAAVSAMFVAFAAAQRKAQASTQLEKGGSSYGVVKGKRHAQGGERFNDHIEVEGGEAWSVYSRSASKKYAKQIQAFTDSVNSGDLSGFLKNSVPTVPSVIDLGFVDRMNTLKAETKKNEIILMGSSGGANMEGVESKLNEIIKKRTYGETPTHFIVEEKGRIVKMPKK